MIFSHIPRPIGTRKTRIGKGIYVHRVPLDTSWFCPYCCATVDTAFLTLGATGSTTRTSAGLTRPLVTPTLPIPQKRVYRGAATNRGVRAASSPSLSLLAEAFGEADSRPPHTTSQRSRKQRASEPIRTADLISLRVITQALQRLAQECKSRIDKPISFLYLAECCTVLRSRWYQSGINRGTPSVGSATADSVNAMVWASDGA
jgi:hypothetical protein